MTFFRALDQVTVADRASVGEKAFYLSCLSQWDLPIVQGGVLTTLVWQQFWAEVAQAFPDLLDRLHTLNPTDGTTLQNLAQTLQQVLMEQPISLELTSLTEPLSAPLLLLRPSLVLPAESAQQEEWAAEILGLWPARLVTPTQESLGTALQHFWAVGLQASNLLVWQRYCQSLTHLQLGTLIQPLYPAEVSGTLILDDPLLTLEAVQGLGLSLSTGEAIPARCQTHHRTPTVGDWQIGYQERVYVVFPTDSSAHPPQVMHHNREWPDLDCPLTDSEIEEIIALGQAARQRLGQAVRLEWIVYTDPGDEAANATRKVAITQATPWVLPAPKSPLIAPAAPTAAPAPRSFLFHQDNPTEAVQPVATQVLEPVDLPMISVVVRGIGAAPGRVMAPAVLLSENRLASSHPLPSGCIAVVSDLQPDMFVQLESAIVGIVTVKGGATCHAAILARELNIPAVVGAPQATELLQTGDMLWLDGHQGVVYRIPATNTTLPLAHAANLWPVAPTSPGRARLEPPQPITTHTKVMVNLSQLRRLQDLPMEQVDGVGLLRSEWLILEALEGYHPQWWIEQGQGEVLQGKIIEKLEPILRLFATKPVRYRSLDLRSHEWITLEGSPPVEPNPMLGIRGAFSYQLDHRLFDIELGALARLQRQGYDQLQIILPFVRTVEEFIVCRQRIVQAGLTTVPSFQLWIMAEVPSVLFLLPAYIQAGVQGIAIGTNDLTQLLLAVDRDQPVMASAYDERHPAVLAAMAHLIQTARQYRIACSICGQAPVRHPELIETLVKWGISSISVESGALEATRQAIWAAEHLQGNPP